MVDNLHVQTRRVPSLRSDGDVSAMNVRAVNEIFGESSVMQALQERVKELAQSDTNVLIAGEPGSGRRLVARAIHSLSRDPSAPLLTAQCSDGADAVSDTIATLNAAARRGVSSAQMTTQRTHGTLILDGLTDLSPRSQLEILQRLSALAGPRETNGHRETQPRVIATLLGSLDAAVAQGTLHSAVAQAFRSSQLSVPPLRDRGEDIESLAHYFVALLNSENDTAKTLSGTSLLALREYGWPGNVQELRAAVQRAYVKADRELDLRSCITTSSELPVGNDVRTLRIAVGTSLADAERWMISATLKKCGGNKTRAAALLGVSLKTLYNRLNAYRAQGLDLNSLDRELSEVAN